MTNNKLHILAEENMPHIEQLFADFASIEKKSGRDIVKEDLSHCDALLCRSITQVDQSLLENTPVKFVGSATIGIDHLDVNWLEKNQIHWANAPGCNAQAVVQYVISGIAFWLLKENKKLSDICVGIVGAGNVGSGLSAALDKLNVDYRLCDPPLQDAGDQRMFVDMSDIWSCDVITFHVPMTKQTNYPTFQLLDKNQLSRLNENQLIINAARGGVISNQDLNQYLANENSAQFILDVFENEPHIDTSLVKRCLLATPHIAGHTLEGKSRGSYMIYQKLCRYFNLPETISEASLYPAPNQLTTQIDEDLLSQLLNVYDIQADSLKLAEKLKNYEGKDFDQLRKDYPKSFIDLPRRDYSGWSAQSDSVLFEFLS